MILYYFKLWLDGFYVCIYVTIMSRIVVQSMDGDGWGVATVFSNQLGVKLSNIYCNESGKKRHSLH